MQNTVVVRQSKLTLTLAFLIVGAITWLGKSMVGDYTLFEALAGGGLRGRFAFFTIIMGILTVVCFIGIFKPLRKVTLDPNGVMFSEVGKKISVPWNEIVSVEATRGGASIKTHQGTVIIGQHMMATKKIIRAIENYSQAMRAAPRRATGTRLFQ